MQLQRQGPRRLLRLVERGSRMDWIGRVVQNRHAGDVGRRRFEQLELLAAHLGDEVGEPGRVPAGPGKTGHEPARHRVAGQGEHDRHRGRDCLGGLCGHRSADHEHVHPEADQLGRELRHPVGGPVRVAVLGEDVLALDISLLAQPLPERGQERVAGGPLADHADAGNAQRDRLRHGGERRRDEEDEGGENRGHRGGHDRHSGDCPPAIDPAQPP